MASLNRYHLPFTKTWEQCQGNIVEELLMSILNFEQHTTSDDGFPLNTATIVADICAQVVYLDRLHTLATEKELLVGKQAMANQI